MRKIFPIIMSASLALAVAGCSSDDNTGTDVTNNSSDNGSSFSGNYDGLYKQPMTDQTQGVELVVDGTSVEIDVVMGDDMPKQKYFKGTLPDPIPEGEFTVPLDAGFEGDGYGEPPASLDFTFDNGKITYVEEIHGTEIPTTMERVGDVSDRTADPETVESTFTDGVLTTGKEKIEITEVSLVDPERVTELGQGTSSRLLEIFYTITNLQAVESADDFRDIFTVEQKLADGSVKETAVGSGDWVTRRGEETSDSLIMTPEETYERAEYYWELDPEITEIIVTAKDPETGEEIGTQSYPISIPDTAAE